MERHLNGREFLVGTDLPCPMSIRPEAVRIEGEKPARCR
jgi:hypothetical protein